MGLPLGIRVAILKSAYGFEPELPSDVNWLVEFSIHLVRRGFKGSPLDHMGGRGNRAGGEGRGWGMERKIDKAYRERRLIHLHASVHTRVEKSRAFK
jgi:hypothetical protein